MTKKIQAIKFIAIGFVLFSNLFDASAQQSKKFETRCGWLDNSSPGSYYLSDKDRQWTIREQGDREGVDFEIPAFKRGQWVKFFGGSYGYGCACLQMKVDYETSSVLEIRKSYSRPLSVCRKDKALRKWKDESE